MTTAVGAAPEAIRFDRWELGAAFADLGVLIPIAVALIVRNGLSPTAVLLPAGLLYLGAACLYRLPIPVQPLKAFGAIAIAQGLGVEEIAAGALLLGAIFVVLGTSGLVDAAARIFPRQLVRGVQLTVGLLFLEIAWGLVADPPPAFSTHGLSSTWLIVLALVVVASLLVRRRIPIALVLVVAGGAVVAATAQGAPELGPSTLGFPPLDASAFSTALVALVLPQLPLSFANSCLATADAARTYFGERAGRVRAGRLATSLGVANLFGGAIGGMPVCHGAGGLTAHYSFGARTAGAPLLIGTTLVGAALLLGAGLAPLLAAFPLSILAGLLAGAGLLHIGLLRDLQGRQLLGAVGVGLLGFATNIALALLVALVFLGAARTLRRH